MKVINSESATGNEPSVVYVVQEIPGTKTGNPKINIMGAAKYGEFKFLLPELSQIIFSVFSKTFAWSCSKSIIYFSFLV